MQPRESWHWAEKVSEDKKMTTLISEINVSLVSYRALNLQNANKMRSVQDSFIINCLFPPSSNIFFTSKFTIYNIYLVN